MSSCHSTPFARAAALGFAALMLVSASTVAQAAPAAVAPTVITGVGRTATAAELQAWDIDVRPDFKGLPAGTGSVAKGQDVWEGKCASCHGVFGESGEVFSPLVGGTTRADVASGHAARLNDRSFPGRTTLMKVSTVSTLWDYIRRAMPWTAPKSLSVEEVYAVTAYLLNMGGVVPDDFVLTDRNIAEVQKLLPNRNGTTTAHALWPGKELGGSAKPDAQGSACMSHCATEPKIASFLPDFARNAHGNLAQQNRTVGAQRGADTSQAEGAAAKPEATAAAPAPAAAAESGAPAKAAIALATKHNCLACHGVTNKIVGPAFQDVAKRHGTRTDATAYLGGKIISGGTGVWGAIPMPAQTLPDADVQAIAQWLASGAPK